MLSSRLRLSAVVALLLLGTALPTAGHAADELVFHPCITAQEQAFVEVELGRGAAAGGAEAGTPGGGWEYAVVDLDEDGTPEVAARLAEPCAGDGCRTVIYTRILDRWVPILETTDREISVARKQSRGYREILTAAGLWRWSGKAYRRVS